MHFLRDQSSSSTNWIDRNIATSYRLIRQDSPVKIHPPRPHEVGHKTSFAPVVNAATRVLILGSLPGDASLAQQQYYAHPQNRFWQLMADVFQLPLVELAYAERLQQLLQHQIGLWDVIAKAQRQGSLDSQIRERDDNDLVRC